MDQRRFMGGRVKGTQVAAAAFVLSLVLLLAVGGITVFVLAGKTTDSADFAAELRRGLVEGCEKNGNERAKAQRETLREEIEEAEHPDRQTFEALVKAGISPTAIRRAEAKAVVKFKKRLHRVKLVDCEAQFPEP